MRTGLALLVVTVFATLMAGCATPCKNIADAGWECSLLVTEPVVPGDLIWVGEDNNIVAAGLKPGELGAQIIERDASVADVLRTQKWTFKLDAGLPEMPGLSAVADAKGSLESAGVRTIKMVFRDSKVRQLDANLDDFKKAKERANAYLQLMSVPERNRVRRAAANSNGEVWLVMQTLESKVDGSFAEGGSLGASAAGTIKGVAIKAGGTYSDDATYTIKFDRSLPIAYRALLIAVPPETGPQAAAPFTVAGSRFDGPNR